MIFGDFDDFAIMAEVVDEWNEDNTFNDGIMILSIDGDIYPKEIINMTLNSEIYFFVDALREIGEDENFFSMEKNEAVREIAKITFPHDINIDNDYRFFITPYEMHDKNYLVFAVRNGKLVRILGIKAGYDWEKDYYLFDNIEVSETYVEWEDIERLIDQLEDYLVSIGGMPAKSRDSKKEDDKEPLQ